MSPDSELPTVRPIVTMAKAIPSVRPRVRIHLGHER